MTDETFPAKQHNGMKGFCECLVHMFVSFSKVAYKDRAQKEVAEPSVHLWHTVAVSLGAFGKQKHLNVFNYPCPAYTEACYLGPRRSFADGLVLAGSVWPPLGEQLAPGAIRAGDTCMPASGDSGTLLPGIFLRWAC